MAVSQQVSEASSTTAITELADHALPAHPAHPVAERISTERATLLEHLPGGVLAAACPSRVVLDHITGRWAVLILVALPGRTMRWSELRRVIQGVSEKMLAQTLQTLERDGLVRRTALPVVPPHVEYSLTDLGESLVERLLPLMEWLLEHSPAIVEGQQPRT